MPVGRRTGTAKTECCPLRYNNRRSVRPESRLDNRAGDEMSWLIIPLALCFLVYCVLVIPRTAMLTAETIFVYLQFIMAVGALPILDPSRTADRVYAAIIIYTLIAFMC